MLGDILFAGWFFLPAGVANMAPIFAAKAPYFQKFSQPIDGGRTWHGQAILGPHKTWRGVISGILAGVLTLFLQKLLFQNFAWATDISSGLDYAALPLAFGALMGFGALAGDAFKSFFKRRLGRKSGSSWFPFDQLDYIIGGLAASLIFVNLELSQYLWIFIIWFGLHLGISYIGYLAGLKPRPI
ncbi:CDP-archaeol synthase [Candidatus Parcubacteria bacterium]|nr:CDP-archaeol synthase [Candidatus Parcubacteria bacterium]